MFQNFDEIFTKLKFVNKSDIIALIWLLNLFSIIKH